MKIYVGKFNRAENALDKLIEKLRSKNMLTTDYDDADYFLLSGDRSEMFDFAVRCLRDNKKVIHLWAGECDSNWPIHDECYRAFITLSSRIQLCTNNHAAHRVTQLCSATEKKSVIHIVGNLMLDNLETDESSLPDSPYTLILYNPLVDRETTKVEIDQIKKIIKNDTNSYIWLPPNGDVNSDLIDKMTTEEGKPRPEFLGLLKHCNKFITNSSCAYYEAPFLMDTKDIISIGDRNINRESKISNMTIPNASDNIIRILEKLT